MLDKEGEGAETAFHVMTDNCHCNAEINNLQFVVKHLETDVGIWYMIGGYGALLFGAKHPDIFGKVLARSAGTVLIQEF